MPEDEKQKIFEMYPDIKAEWHEVYGDRLNQLVFIGRNYDKDAFLAKLRSCLAA